MSIPSSVTLEVCSLCGELQGLSAHGHTGQPWHWEPVVYLRIDISHAFDIRAVVPDEHHRGPRIHVRGSVVDEDYDQAGDYAVIEAPEQE